MSFFMSKNNPGYAPGWFLAEAECTRETRQIAQNHAQVVTGSNGAKHVPMGAFYPANNSGTVEGIVYEDVDVTYGAMPGSVVTKGLVYLDRLPAAPESGVQSALEGKGFKFITSAPATSRPNYNNSELVALSVASEAGTASGDTKITVSGYTLKSGESYVYKVATGTAPAVDAGDILTDGWTAWDGEDDITAATDKKITVAVIDITKAAVAAGSATVTAHA
jgi:hypothetical protein